MSANAKHEEELEALSAIYGDELANIDSWWQVCILMLKSGL